MNLRPKPCDSIRRFFTQRVTHSRSSPGNAKFNRNCPFCRQNHSPEREICKCGQRSASWSGRRIEGRWATAVKGGRRVMNMEKPKRRGRRAWIWNAHRSLAAIFGSLRLATFWRHLTSLQQSDVILHVCKSVSRVMQMTRVIPLNFNEN